METQQYLEPIIDGKQIRFKLPQKSITAISLEVRPKPLPENVSISLRLGDQYIVQNCRLLDLLHIEGEFNDLRLNEFMKNINEKEGIYIYPLLLSLTYHDWEFNYKQSGFERTLNILNEAKLLHMEQELIIDNCCSNHIRLLIRTV